MVEKLDPANFEKTLKDSTEATEPYKPDQCYDPMVKLVIYATGPGLIGASIDAMGKPTLVDKAGVTEEQKAGWFIPEFSRLDHSIDAMGKPTLVDKAGVT